MAIIALIFGGFVGLTSLLTGVLLFDMGTLAAIAVYLITGFGAAALLMLRAARPIGKTAPTALTRAPAP